MKLIMLGNRFMTYALIVIAVVIFTCSLSTAETGSSAMEWHGTHGFRETMAMIISDRELWSSIYKTLYESDKIPTIDFDRHMIVAVFMGYRGERFDVKILKAQEMYVSKLERHRFAETRNSINNIDEKLLVVEYEYYFPDLSKVKQPETTSPFHMVMIPKSSLSVAFVKRYKFQENR